MLLHEAIKEALVRSGGSLSASDIADFINENQLYHRGDGAKVPSGQINARVSKYPDLFVIEGKIIKLNLNSELDIQEAHIQSLLLSYGTHFKIAASHSTTGFYEFMLASLIAFEQETPFSLDSYFERLNKIGKYARFIQNMDERFLLYFELLQTISAYPNRPQILRKLTYWIFNPEFNSTEFLLPEYISQVIGGLSVYRPSAWLSVNANIIPTYILDIIDNNPGIGLMTGFLGHPINEENSKLYTLLLKGCNKNFNHLSVNEDVDHFVSVITPAIHQSSVKSPTEFHDIKELIKRNQNLLSADSAFLIVRQELLSMGGKYLLERQELIDTRFLKTIVSLPNYYAQNWTGPISILYFDFSQEHNEVFMADFTANQDFDPSVEWKSVVELINNGEAKYHISKFVPINEIKDSRYSLVPRFYLYKLPELIDNEEFKIFTLKELILSSVTGKYIKKQLLYPEGEIKIIRTRDLGKNYKKRIDTLGLMGVDSDSVEKSSVWVEKGVVISLSGTNLNALQLDIDRKILLGTSLAHVIPNSTIILAQYLVKELNSAYVQEQIDHLSSGSSIRLIAVADLLTIKIKTPYIHRQYEILEKDWNSWNVAEEALDGSDYALSFNFISTIKHTLKQQISPLSSDFKSLINYLNQCIDNKKPILWDDLLVAKFEHETNMDISAYNLKNTITRIQNYIKQSDVIIEKAEDLLKISQMVMKKINLFKLFHNLKYANPDIQFEISKSRNIIIGDEFQLKMAFQNMIDNARKHGFNEGNKPWKISLMAVDRPHNEMLDVIFKNNGESFPSDFNEEEYFIKGGGFGVKKGTGFGGYIISKVIENHKGKIHLIPSKELEMNEFKVQINIELPKL
jgi:signal transduction histidine kinase